MPLMTINDLPGDVALAVVDQADLREIFFASAGGERRTASQPPWGTITMRRHETHGYFVVVYSEAAAGWGPFLYTVAIELATEDSSGLVPDRRVVSQDALYLWERLEYYNDSIEQQALSLSQVDRLHGDETLDSLYHARPVNVADLLAAGRLSRL